METSRHTTGLVIPGKKLKIIISSNLIYSFFLWIYGSSDMSVKRFDLIHGKEKNFKWKECDYSSIYPSIIVKHVVSVNRKEKSLKCNECDWAFSLNVNLKKHINAVHRHIRKIKKSNVMNAIFLLSK